MDKPLIRRDRITSRTYLLHEGVSNGTSETKARITTHPYHFSARDPLGQLWDNPLVTLGKTSAWLAGPGRDPAAEGTISPAHGCSSTVRPTPSCLRGSCMPYFHAALVHFPFSASVSIRFQFFEGPTVKCHSPYSHGAAYCSFSWKSNRLPKILVESITPNLRKTD